MSNVVLKAVCTFAALFGAISLLLLWYPIYLGYYSGLHPFVAAVKLGAGVVRAVCLISCMWAAWRSPHLAVWFAWIALVAFAVAGYAGSGGNLLPVYYVTLGAHAILLVIVRALVSTPAPAG